MKVLGVTDDVSATRAFANAPELITSAKDVLKHSDEASGFIKGILNAWRAVKPFKSGVN